MTYLACVIGFGFQTDILPIAVAALADRPDVRGITALELCVLVDKHCHRQLPKNVYPPIPNETIEFLIRRVVSRAFNIHRITQIEDPDIKKMRPFVDFKFGPVLCEDAAKLTGRFHQNGTLLVFPLAGCKYGFCGCHYVTASRRDLERNGRIDGDGEPLPLPCSQPTLPN